MSTSRLNSIRATDCAPVKAVVPEHNALALKRRFLREAIYQN